MKKIKKMSFKTTIVMALALVLLTGTFAFGESMVQVKGYLGEDYSEEDIKKARSQFSVSNVTDINVLNVYEYMSNLEVKSPSMIILEDSPFLFSVYRASFDEEGNLNYSEEDTLPILGDVKIYLYDEETGESSKKVVDSSEVEDYENVSGVYPVAGSTVELTEPGYYYVLFRYEAIAGSTEAIIKVVNGEEEVKEEIKEEVKEEKDIIGKQSNSKVLIDGEEVLFDSYNIEGNNYFKLRDLAKSLTGSEKQFDVNWNNEKKAIELLSNREYTVVGGELQTGNSSDKLVSPNMSKIYKDGEEIELLAYKIDGNNYFKLRDIGEVFDFDVDWDGEKRIIEVVTVKSL